MAVFALACDSGPGSTVPDETAASETSDGSEKLDTPPEALDEAAVRKAFENYRVALQARNGTNAAAIVDQKTLEWYDRILELARSADRAQLAQFDLMVQFSVLQARLAHTGKALESMDGRGFFVAAVEAGMVSDSSVAAFQIDRIEISGNRGSLFTKGMQTPVFQLFHDGEHWRIELWKVMAMAEPAFRKLFAESGHSDAIDWCLATLDATAPEKVDPSLADGPR